MHQQQQQQQQQQHRTAVAAAAAAAVNFYDFPPMDRLLHKSGDYSIVPMRLPATLARALYDNSSSYDSELDFKKGAILTVLDQSPAGLDGWWLCCYRGRNGIAPGNRLQLIGVLEAPEKPRLPPKAVSGPDLPPRNSVELQQQQQQHQRGGSWDFYDSPDSVVRLSGPQDAAVSAAAAAAAAASRRSSGISTSSATSAAAPAPAPPPPRQVTGGSAAGVAKSVRFDDQKSAGQPIYAEVYKRTTPTSITTKAQEAAKASDPEPYDDPERLNRQISDTYDELPDVVEVSPTSVDSTDVPLRQKTQPQPQPPPPPPPPMSSSRGDYQNLSDRDQATRNADGSKHTITKEFLDSLLAPGSLESAEQQEAVERRQRQSARDGRSVTPSIDSITSEDIQFRPECRILLEQADAVRLLRDLERDFSERCARMYRFVHSRWKTEASLALNAAGIRLTLREARGFLDQLIDFFHGVLNNSRLESCPDRALARKLWRHLRSMEQSQAELGESVAQLDRLSWSPKAVSAAAAAVSTDHLGIAISALRELQIQQRTLSTTVQANATLLFPALKQQQQHQQQQHSSSNGENVSNNSLYMRMSSMNEALNSDNSGNSSAGNSGCSTSNLSRTDREALAFFAEKIANGARIYEAMCQDLSGALYSGQASLVVGALSKNAVSRGFKLNQAAILLHDALHSRQLRLRLEEVINRFGHHLKGILTASKAVMTATTATTLTGMSQLHGHIADSLKALKEIAEVLAMTVDAVDTVVGNNGKG